MQSIKSVLFWEEVPAVCLARPAPTDQILGGPGAPGSHPRPSCSSSATHTVSLCVASQWGIRYSTNINHQSRLAWIFLTGESLRSCVPIGPWGAWPPFEVKSIHHKKISPSRRWIFENGLLLRGYLHPFLLFSLYYSYFLFIMMQPIRQTEYDN